MCTITKFERIHIVAFSKKKKKKKKNKEKATEKKK